MTSRGTSGTEISGVIAEDTTWTVAGNPYHVVGPTEIRAGVTLTIEAGVDVVVDEPFILAGNFVVLGTALDPVRLLGSRQVLGQNRGTQLLESPTLASAATYGVEIHHAIIQGFSAVVNEDNLRGYVNITDSLLRDISWRSVLLYYPAGDSFIERNTFVRAAGIWVQEAKAPDGARLYVRSNRFVSFWPESLPEEDWVGTFGGDGEPTEVSGNTFETTGEVAVRLLGADGDNGWVPGLDATGNHWGTTDTASIDAMIWDVNDDAALVSTIPYEPFITEPNQGTPQPYPQEHERLVTLRLRQGISKAAGRVLVPDRTSRCNAEVTVRLQRKFDGSWTIVRESTTDQAGHYAVPLRIRRARYRTVASSFGFSLYDSCNRAISDVASGMKS
jgi:hypothetical protein